MWYRLLKFVLIGPVLRILGRPKVEGLHHVPKGGPVIIAANHLAAIDSLYLALVLPRRITFLAKSQYFDEPGLRGRINRWVMTATGQVRVDRSGGSASADALAAAVEILESGGVWGIHPEGTRSPDGRVYRGRTGVIRVAMRTGAPVVPVALSGTDRVNRRGRRLLRFGRVRIVFGAPRTFLPVDRAAVRTATDGLMAELAMRSGRRYVDCYAAHFRAESA
ncbi:1-acyl-sn-glycerol-3-phosphate acyltransferase [Nocardia nova]|uniref:1-acyl-sn-glycerol-3-phosphate acyltransferase n=1 Tax=Nocardia nova TaxID=37330 RepID=A0A2S6AGW7_9NOCA|nr:lysophospholipid acyltransferase family protein [Nocardia nova]PPJ28788.1 1-acyl-sn-glycerol-3-phosphate acyltransferase [Nocardia nova]PPJ34006.1 1-acyl-sn-glycerol-3-phosphate acyltransferase [Nocardia nova]